MPDDMPLGHKQELFMGLQAILVMWAISSGYKIRGGELWRSPETAAIMAAKGTGVRNSLHILKLAIDLNLFQDDLYLSTTEAHAPLGAFWKSLHPLCRWGGDFKRADGTPKPDGNHYSLEHLGVK